MNYLKIVKSMSALQEMMQMRLPYAKAKVMYKIYKNFEDEYKFFVQEEIKLVNEFAAKDEQGKPIVYKDGTVKFDNIESKNKYEAKLSELGALKSDIQIKPIVLTEVDIGEQIISPEIMGKLEGIISFE